MPRAKATAGAAKKPRATKEHKLAEQFPNGEILRDLCKKDWRLGDVIGRGGFGLIYLASDKDTAKVGPDAQFVVKIEPINNGPLFCELHFYQRVAKPDTIDSWLQSQKLKYLGVPRYISSGQHSFKGTNYRFMVMQRFSTDLQKIFENAGKIFSKQTVYSLALRLIDALEYIHENGYIHADIKASNCLLGYKSGKPDPNTVYLVDYGLAAKYTPNGKHREYKEEPKKAHDGTIEFTSIDAHKGVDPSRRGDLEVLGYCLLQWLCTRLPWEDKLSDPNYVRDSKIKHMGDISGLMKKCFPHGNAPEEMSTFLMTVKKMQYEEKPNYNKIREIFQKGLTKLGVKDLWKLALPLTGPTKPGASPKKGVKRRSEEAGLDEPVKKLKVASPRPRTPKGQTKPANPKQRVGTPKTQSRPTTPKVKATTPTAKKRTTVKSPLANKARQIGKKAITKAVMGKPSPGRGSPIVNGVGKESKGKATKARVLSPKGESPALKKKKVVRRKNVKLCEMAVQTSPGLKQNR